MKNIALLIAFFFTTPLACQTHSISTLTFLLEHQYQIEIYYDSIEVVKLKLDTTISKKRGELTIISNRFETTRQKDTVILKKHLHLLANEFQKYPKDYFQRIGMKSLCLLKSVYFGDSRREAVPDNLRGTLLLESSNRLINDSTYLKYAFHHDLHHFAEMGASLNRVKLWKKWAKLNPKKFKYFGSGSMQDQKRYANVDFSYLHPKEGFITNYALTAAVEDRAEMASYMMIPEYQVKMLPLLNEDKRLKKKADFIMNLLNKMSDTTDNYWMKAMLRRLKFN